MAEIDEILGKMDNVKKRMIDALCLSYGVVTSACNAADIPRSTFYNWLQTDPDFKAAVADVNDIAIDFVEGKLYEKIKAGDTIATIFYLKSKAKQRGYVERQEIEHSGELGITWNEEKTYERLGPAETK